MQSTTCKTKQTVFLSHFYSHFLCEKFMYLHSHEINTREEKKTMKINVVYTEKFVFMYPLTAHKQPYHRYTLANRYMYAVQLLVKIVT